MRGYNVLFPAGFQPSGLPTVAFSLKVKNKDPMMIEHLRMHRVPNDIIEKLSDPFFAIDFFRREYIKLWKKLGYSIDWRREICSTDPEYNKFIEWQFYKLMEKGLLIQKPHYAPFCPNCGPVAVDPSETDVSKGGKAEIIEFTIIKFRINNLVIPIATLRPETIFGITNIWINPEETYVGVRINNETWIVSETAARKLFYQKEKTEKTNIVFKGKELVGKYVEVPVVNRIVPILPAEFVDPNIGTGIVMSVPAHDPFDYSELQKLREHKETEIIRIISNIKPISIIKVEGYGEYPAADIVQNEKYKYNLEKAKEKLYLDELSKGIMKNNCLELSGLPVSVAREKIKKILLNENSGDVFYEFSEEVICRCGSRVFIKRISDQWFIKYSDENLKGRAHECVKEMTIKPDEYHRNIHYIIDWYGDRACVRKGRWLGTRFPFDREWIIEPISDSTIYPAMYIISKFINSGLIKTEQLTPEFFDYVLLGRGNPKEIAEKIGISLELIEELRKDFEYWYPVDLNCGGKEHMSVHFPVYIFNHVAIFPKKHWPRGIFVNWWVMGKGGGKISKSKGGAEPVPNLVERYTADAIRLYYAHIASPHSDVEWSEDVLENYSKRIEAIWNMFQELLRIARGGINEQKAIDKWLLSRINRVIAKTTEHMDNYEIREAAHLIFFELYKDIQWWIARGGASSFTARYTLDRWARLMAPFTPHIAEEIWEQLGNKGFISLAEWCKVDEGFINKEVETREEYIKSVIEDIRKILLAVKRKPRAIYIYTAPDWVWELYSIMAECEGNIHKSFKEARRRLNISISDNRLIEMLKKIVSLKKLDIYTKKLNEVKILIDNKDFLERTFSATVKINDKHDPLGKRNKALPLRPAIYIEYAD